MASVFIDSSDKVSTVNFN